MDEDTQYHAMRELGDIMWYWMNSCSALGIDPNDVIAENVNKLKKRYPGGEFDVHYSENRKEYIDLDLNDFGIEILTQFSGLSLLELRDLINQEMLQLSEAHYYKFFNRAT